MNGGGLRAAAARSEPLTIEECRGCGYLAHPPRILCPRCGGGEWRRRRAGAGVVTELTETREGLRVGAIRAAGGVRVLARLEGRIGRGDTVELFREGRAAIARAGR